MTPIPHSRPWITAEDRRAVAACLVEGMIAEGERARAFENAFASAWGFNGAVTTPSGTTALTLALKALGIGAGDEVVVPTYVCQSVVDAVLAAGAAPVLCDVGESWVMTADTVAPVLTRRTKAIVAVHVFGIAADVAGLAALCPIVIEDCCQALGAKFNGRTVGSAGRIAMYSFHATKCLTTGEGGLLASNDIGLLAAARAIRDKERWSLSDFQAALGTSQLQRYNNFLARRRHIAEAYFRRLPHSRVAALRALEARSMFFRFPLRYPGLDSYEAAEEIFLGHGVTVRRGVDTLLHRQAGFPDRNFPHATRLYEETVSIPILPSMRVTDVDRVIRSVLAYEKSR